MSDEKALFNDSTAVQRAEKFDADLSLELSDEQRKTLVEYVSKNGFPSAIELNFKGSLDAGALFPVTVLVGAMA